MNTSALSFERVTKHYDSQGGTTRVVLEDLSFSIETGQRVAIVGPRGSGKSTLLQLAAGIDIPTSGTVRVNGSDLSLMDESGRALLRRRSIGLVFQFFHLIPHLSVADNVLLPAFVAGSSIEHARGRCVELLESVGLGERMGDDIQQLSEGDQQRVAIARAIFADPQLILADEPTGGLDSETGIRVTELMLSLVDRSHTTVIMVGSDAALARLADQTWYLSSGRLTLGGGGPQEARGPGNSPGSRPAW